MIEIKKIAAVDIGSNAIRLVIYHIIKTDQEPIFNKEVLHRAPIRIGTEVFNQGKISDKTTKRINLCLDAFLKLIKVHEVSNFKVCATEAFRSASNGESIIAKINLDYQIDIEIIDGIKEAEYISNGPLFESMNPLENYLFIDLGGGSTELSFYQNNQCVMSKSFQIGTLRMLEKTQDTGIYDELLNWLNKALPKDLNINIIGSGGNINKLYKLCGRKNPEPLQKAELEGMYEQLKALSFEERIKSMRLREDRADVIVPACKIFLMILQATQINHLFVPKIGLADGIIRNIYYNL